MARTNFNFQATLKLKTDEFKKGVKDIQKSLNGLKTSFLQFASAIGLSLGLGKFVSMIKDTAVQLDTAQNVLKNVSTTTVEYAESMAYLRKISNDYGQDLITLVNNFAQFRAAAKDSGLAIDELRNIYGSLTRAAGAYHLSADKTNDMMLAVTQMFSKGKVASEELRRQMGNVLPGAFNLMAKAAQMAGITTNGTTAELEEMMKKGKVLAKDVMPSFAKVLDEVTASASFNSLQQSISRLGNTWTSFVEKGNFAGIYQGFIDGLNKALGSVTRNFSTVKALLIGGGAGILGIKLWNKGKSAAESWSAKLVAEIDRVGDRAEKAQAKYEKIFGTAYTFDYKTLKHLYENPVDKRFKPSEERFKQGRDAILEYNKAILEADKLSRQLGRPAILDKEDIAGIKKNIKDIEADMRSSGQVAVDSMTRMQKGLTALRIGFSKLKLAIKAAFSSMLIGAIISVVTFVVSKLIEARKETNRIANIVKDAEDSIEKVSAAESETVVNLREARKELEGNEKSSLRYQKAVEGVNKIMGLVGDKAYTIETNTEDIVKAVDIWIARLKEVARTQAIISKINELTAKNIELENENDLIRKDDNSYWYRGRKGKTENLLRTRYTEKLGRNTTEINNNTKAIDNLTAKLDAEGLEQLYGQTNNSPLAGLTPDSGTTSGGTKNKPKTKLDEVNKVFDDYNDKLSKLNNQLKAGAIDLETYNDEYDKLIRSTYLAASEFGDLDEYLKGFDKQKIKGLKGKLDWLKQLFGGIGSEDLVNDDGRLQSIGENLLEKIEREIAKGLENGVKNRKAQDIYAGIRGPKKRDTTFDYKLDKVDIAKEEYDNLKEYLDHLRELRNELAALGQAGTEQFQKLNILIGEAAQQTTNFRDRARLAEWKKDIEDLSKAYNDQLYSSIRDVASSFERLYNVYKDFAEVFGAEIDPNGTFQKILTIFGALFETFETIYSVIQSINALEKASAALEKAKNDENMKALSAQIALESTLGATRVAASEAATGAMIGETVAAKSLGSALKGVAAAAAVANAMELPYPYNLAALASNVAAAAGAYATMKGLSAFANGGIVGGNSMSGDRNLIRANSGEMILTRGQQGTLFDMLNGKKSAGGGEVTFKIHGSDLTGVLKNYNQKRKG